MNITMAAANMKNISKINELLEIGKANKTLCNLGTKLHGADANEAYRVLLGLSDHELRIIAAMIGQINEKFK